ncbi:hypothetical protein BWD42_07850 [Sphingobacterium sp. CZ-UAM]|uniref:hypothetical protein n=1 Tax=Sphingobacterium sp. CZ-UAM TaxID=1933868 RepID=UPI0009874D9D|nr:hypothetical protein [Sphingobacterium sp. CZ-UAM]OOG19801.1 hypothetical protein BWD42_07850 [Sphingobacterium sp. CZ-UAM]
MKAKKLTLTGHDFSNYKKIINSEDFSGYVFIWSTTGIFKGAFYSKNGRYAKVYDKTMNLKNRNK